ncbi:hypothetical protein HCN44_000323 [Aphidius gifuensis]|uniref:Uncharacterized protein n=1 Tax=Aphidius gifuensis TaxID=684658 RepID=A0A834XQ30_APHGI|nr:hypothetical protein HCN44_000323 [Aphidius gifuensis]
MWALILWLNSKESDVIPKGLIKKSSSGQFKAKWGDQYFHIRILMESEDKDWLQSIDVDTDGKLSQPKKNKKKKSDPSVLNKKKIQHNVDKNIVNKKDIFDQRISNSESNQINESSEQLNVPQIVREAIGMTEPTDERTTRNINFLDATVKTLSKTSLDNSNAKEPVAGPSVSSSSFKNSFVHDEQSVTSVAQPNCLKSALLSTMTDNVSSQFLPKDESLSSGSCSPQSEVELVPGSGVMIDSWWLKVITSRYKKKPDYMAKQLMKKIIGTDRLLNMTVFGGKGREAIPKDVFNAVKSKI